LEVKSNLIASGLAWLKQMNINLDDVLRAGMRLEK
jgi:hypothetical protein